MTVASKETYVLPIKTHGHVHRENAARRSGSLGCFCRTPSSSTRPFNSLPIACHAGRVGRRSRELFDELRSLDQNRRATDAALTENASDSGNVVVRIGIPQTEQAFGLGPGSVKRDTSVGEHLGRNPPLLGQHAE